MSFFHRLLFSNYFLAAMFCSMKILLPSIEEIKILNHSLEIAATPNLECDFNVCLFNPTLSSEHKKIVLVLGLPNAASLW